MVEKLEDRCSCVMQQRLSKYDLVEPLMRQGEAEDIISNFKVACNEEKVMHSEGMVALSVLERIFSNSARDSFYLFEALCGIPFKPQYKDINLPESIHDIYQRSMDNLKIFRQGDWWIYEKDVLRAVAYHDYVSDFKISKDEIVKGGPFYDREKYLNLPIDLKVQVESNDIVYYVFPEIGGGIINKLHWYDSKTSFRNIFLKEYMEFGPSGEYKHIKKKGINYEILRNGIKDITAKPMSLADVWFFKNIFDPELFTCIYLALKGRSILTCDYSLIWILSGCKCPSIRLYVFEAIKHCYLYIREFIGPNDKSMEFLLKELTTIVDSINNIFQNMVNITSFCLKRYSTSSEDAIANNSKIKKAFQRGDDFPFLLETNDIELIQSHKNLPENGGKGICKGSSKGEKVKRKSENGMNISKGYCEYMPETAELSMDKIAYCVITALNEQWGLSVRKKEERKDFEESAVKFQEQYNSRLLYHLKGNQ